VDGETEIQVNALESNIVGRQMRLGDGTEWPYGDVELMLMLM